MSNVPHDRPVHGHHKIAAAIFVSSLILSAAMILSAEVAKPARYEFQKGPDMSTYIIYDRDTGKAAIVDFNSKDPTASLSK